MKIKIIFTIFSLFLLASCGQTGKPVTTSAPVTAPASIAAATQAKTETVKRFYYSGEVFRDPFVQITAESAAQISHEGIVIPSLSSLTLQGIVRYSGQTIALLKSGSAGYFIINGRIYDQRQRLIKGMKGLIKDDSVVVSAADSSRKEIKLRELIYKE